MNEQKDIVGYISEAEGTVLIANEKGEIRIAHVGDPVYLNETIVNQSGANVIIELVNNQLINLNTQQQIVVTPDFFKNSADNSTADADTKAATESEDTAQTITAAEPDNAEPEKSKKPNQSNDTQQEPKDTYLKEVIIDHDKGAGNALANESLTNGPEQFSPEVVIAEKNQNPINQKPKIGNQSFFVDENSNIDGSIIAGQVFAKDPEGVPLTYKILSGNENNKFAIDSATGDISVIGELNYERTDTYNLVIEVSDPGNLSETATITININDINEVPIARQDSGSGYENETLIIDVLANDRDEDFTDSPRNFSLDAVSVVDQVGNVVSGQGTVSINNNRLVFTPNTDFDDLATGETKNVTVRYRMSDDDGLSSESFVSLVITGTNDTPTISVVDVEADIDHLNRLDESGSINFADVDLSDRPTASEATKSVSALRADGSTTLALTDEQQQAIEDAFTISAGSDNTNNGEVSWNYQIDRDDVTFLSEGETVEAVFTITVDDGQGGTAEQDVNITITGKNVDPVLVASVDDTVGTVTEAGTLTDSGTIAFEDVNLSDRPTAAETTKSVSALRADGTTALALSNTQQQAIEDAFTISADSDNSNDGTIYWDYTIDETDLDFLAEGEEVTAVFTMTLTDDYGGSDVVDITITINGTNDGLRIVSAITINGDVTELVDNHDNEGTATLTDSGRFSIADPDLTDVQSVSSSPLNTGYHGTFTPSIGTNTTGTGQGVIDWSFSVSDSAIDYLAVGQTLIQNLHRHRG